MLPIIYYRRDFGNIAANQTQAVIEQLVWEEQEPADLLLNWQRELLEV